MKGEKALSMMELIIVVMLMALMVGAMMPMASMQLQKSLLNGEIEKLLLDIQQTQQYALTHGDGC